ALEGLAGLKRRLQAAAHAFGLTAEMLQRITVIDRLTLADTRSLHRTASQIGFVDVVIIDTFARALVNLDENSATDVGRALNGCLEFSRSLGDAAVLLTHHTNRAT